MEIGQTQDLLTGFEGEETGGVAISERMVLGYQILAPVDSKAIEGDPTAHDDLVVLDGGWRYRLRLSDRFVHRSFELVRGVQHST